MKNKVSIDTACVLVRKVVRGLFFIAALMVANSVLGQSFSLNGKDYKFSDGKWYTFFAGIVGDEIIPSRIVARRHDQGDITVSYLQQLGIDNIEMASSRFLNGYYVIRILIEDQAFEIAQRLENTGEFSMLAFDARGKPTAAPDDTHFSNQWNLGATKLSMEAAWDISTGANSVVLGVIDTGADLDHPDLNGNIWTNIAEIQGQTGVDDDGNGKIDDYYGWDFDDLDKQGNPIEDGYPDDTDTLTSHGTHVTGIIGAETNNNLGVAGIAGGWGTTQGIQLMIVKDCYLNEWRHYSRLAQAIEYAAKTGADVISITEEYQINYQTLNDAVKYAADTCGVVVVCASGNSPLVGMGYPAKYSNTIAVGATTQSDTRRTDSSYGNELDVVAPGTGIWTTDIVGTYGQSTGDYYGSFYKTSAACPHVAALAGLVLSVNSSLSNTQVREIICSTAEKVGGYNYNQQKDYGSWNNEMGYGRINAYQALLYALAFENESHSSLATAYNNGRRLIRDGNNRYHLVFQSGGEIFYRRSNVGASSWEKPLRLSIGDGINKYPSISGTSSKQFVVWQHYDTGNSKYYTCFSKNTGSGWSDADTIDGLSDFSASNDPLPVISYKNNDRVVVCIRGSAKLRYAYSDNNGSSWTASDLSFTSSSHANPSLSMGPTTPASTIYLTYDNGSTIYLNSYTTSWGSAASIPAGTATTNSQYSSVEVDGAGGIDVAWEGRKKFANQQIILHRRKHSGSWQTAKYFESGSSYNYLRPSITGHDSDKRSLVWYGDNGAVYRAYFNGSSWSEAGITDTWLQHANISAGTTTARYVATSGSASPYTVYLVNETLPLAAMKVAVNSEQLDNDLIFTPLAHLYHRSASLAGDDSLGLLWAELGEIAVNNQMGDQMAINLIAVNEESLSVTPRNLFDYLQTETFSLAADAHTLEWQQKFYSYALEYLVAPGIAEITVNVLLNDSVTGTPLTRLAQIRLPISLSDSLMEAKVITDVTAYRGQQVYLTVQVQGVDNNKPGMRAELGDIFIIQDDQFLEKGVPPQEDYQPATNIPSQYELKQNYPNPFNAITTLRYHLPQASQVTLKIYNLLGQQVRTLVDDHQAAGYHTVQWDGRDDMGTVVVSGVYCYVIRAGEFIDGRKMVVLR